MNVPLPQQYVSEEQLRAEALRELGIEDLRPEAQDEIMATVRQTLIEYVNIAVMKALGPEGIMALSELEEKPEELSKKLLERVPNIGAVVNGAIAEGLGKHRAAVADVRTRFGMPTGSAVQSG